MSIFASVMQQPKPLYEILEYIQSTGTQYIDSGVKALKGYTSTIRFQATSMPTSGQYMESWIMSVYQSSSPWRCGIIDSALNTSDGYTYSQSSPLKETTASGVCPANLDFSLVIFGQNENSGVQHVANSKYKLWYLKISSATGKPVRDYVPARRIADSAIGLYDRVEKKFYENAGTGAFAAGSATGEVVMSVSAPTLVTREVAALVARGEKAINRNMSKVYRTVHGVAREVFSSAVHYEKIFTDLDGWDTMNTIDVNPAGYLTFTNAQKLAITSSQAPLAIGWGYGCVLTHNFGKIIQLEDFEMSVGFKWDDTFLARCTFGLLLGGALQLKIDAWDNWEDSGSSGSHRVQNGTGGILVETGYGAAINSMDGWNTLTRRGSVLTFDYLQSGTRKTKTGSLSGTLQFDAIQIYVANSDSHKQSDPPIKRVYGCKIAAI